MNYENMIRKAFDELPVTLSEEMLEGILFRIKTINRIIVAINDGDENKKLRSTQMVSTIIFDYINGIDRTVFF